MPAHDDPHPPRKLRKNRAGRKDPLIRDGGTATDYVRWVCSCFELCVDPHNGRLGAWQKDAMPDGTIRWTQVEEFFRCRAPEEAL